MPLKPAAHLRVKRSAPAVGWRRWIAGLAGLSHYRLAWLRHDIVAGLALSAVLLPVGIADEVASP
jgi:MFS superfamily sulfate permease-like transporter